LDIAYIQSIESYGLISISSVVPVAPHDDKPSRRLTKSEREAFSVPKELKEILVGLLLGDLNAEKQKTSVNIRLRFIQGTIHIDYLEHLFKLFSDYCSSAPKIHNPAPDRRTGKVYSYAHFKTYSLVCFNEFYNLFYPAGKKVVPTNIEELLTPLGLAY